MTVKGRTIKAFSPCIIMLLMSLVFMSCASAEYEHMSSGDGESAIIIRGETVYEFYGFVSNRKLTGPQIGILDGDVHHKVFQVTGYSDEDWLLSELDVLMERGIYSLYRSEHVVEIPDDFVHRSDGNTAFLRNYS